MSAARSIAMLALPLALLAGTAPTDVRGADVPVPPIAMPAGISIHQTSQGPVFATAAGMTLYKKLPMEGSWALAAGQANAGGACAYQCPSEWPAAVAPANAAPVGDFTIVVDAQGTRQWAYKGVPLLTFKYDRAPGDTLGEDTFAFNGPRRPVGEAAWIESDVPLAEPPPVPAPTAALPSGIGVQRVSGGNRVFTTADGRTLYTRRSAAGTDACRDGCPDRTPLPAAVLARAVGDWTVIEQADGGRRWAYRGQPVFTFAGDRGARDVEGETADWHAVLEYVAPLPAEVAIGPTESGPVFTQKSSGRTLYYQGFAPRPYEYLGFNHPGRRFGTVNCYNDCAEEYPPLLASADAVPVGEWWIVTRLDGGRQWAWRGVPIYLYAADQPGRHLASYRDHRWAVLKAE